MEPKNNQMPGVFDLIKSSYSFYVKNYKNLILIGLVPFIISSIYQIFYRTISGIGSPENPAITPSIIFFIVIAIVLYVVNLIFQILLQISYVKGIDGIDNGKFTSLETLYKSSWSIILPYVWISILTSLVIMGGFSVFLIPGIALGGYLMFTRFTNIIEGKKGLNALTTSFYYMKGNWWRVFLTIFACNILIMLVFGFFMFLLPIGLTFLTMSINGLSFNDMVIELGQIQQNLFWIIYQFVVSFVVSCVFYPIIIYPIYKVYKHIKSTKPEPVLDSPELKSVRNWGVGLSIWGVVSTVLMFVSMVVIFFFLSFIAKNQALGRTYNRDINSQFTQTSIPLFDSEKIDSSVYVPSNLSNLETEEYVNEDIGFSINVPKGFKPKNYGSGAEKDMAFEDPINHPRSLIEIQTINEVLNDDFDAEQVARGILTNGIKLEGIEFSKFYLNPELTYKISGLYNTKVDTGSFQYYIVNDDKKTYVITMTWNDEDSGIIEPIFMDSLHTFKVLK